MGFGGKAGPGRRARGPNQTGILEMVVVVARRRELTGPELHSHHGRGSEQGHHLYAGSSVASVAFTVACNLQHPASPSEEWALACPARPGACQHQAAICGLDCWGVLHVFRGRSVCSLGQSLILFPRCLGTRWDEVQE